MDRVWVIGEQYAPDQNTTAYYLTRIAEGLAEKIPVAVLCGQPNYASRGLRAPSFEELNKVEVRRCRGLLLDKNVLVFKVLNMITLGFSVFVNALFRLKRKDRVLVATSPPLMPFIVAAACRIRRTPFVVLVFDRYPQELIAAGLAKENGFLAKFFNRCNAWLYRSAETIVTVGRDMEMAVSAHAGSSREKVRTIQNWALLEDVFPVPKKECGLVSELGLQDKFVVLYAGNMGPPQDLESVVEAARMMNSPEFRGIHFLFIGSGRKREWLEKTVRENALGNVTVLSPRPLSEQNSFLNACDIAVVPLVKGMKSAAMPSRTYNFMAAAKPLIAVTEPGSELALVIEEERIGWVVDPDSPAELKACIVEASQAGDELGAMAKRALTSVREKYSWEAAFAKYIDLFGLSETLSDPAAEEKAKTQDV